MIDRLFITLQVLRGDLTDRLEDHEGASMVEYGLLVALIAVVVAGGARVLGANIDTLFRGLTF